MRIGIATPAKSKYKAPTAGFPRGYPAQGPLNISLIPGELNRTNPSNIPFAVFGRNGRTIVTQTVFPLFDRADPDVADPNTDFQVVNFVAGRDDPSTVVRAWFRNENDTTPCFSYGFGFQNDRDIPANSSISATLRVFSFRADNLNDPSTWRVGEELNCFSDSFIPAGDRAQTNTCGEGAVTLEQSQGGIPPKMKNKNNINLNIPESDATGQVGWPTYNFTIPPEVLRALERGENYGMAINYAVELQLTGETALRYTGWLKLAFRSERI